MYGSGGICLCPPKYGADRQGKNRGGSTPYANKRNRKRKNKPKRK